MTMPTPRSVLALAAAAAPPAPTPFLISVQNVKSNGVHPVYFRVKQLTKHESVPTPLLRDVEVDSCEKNHTFIFFSILEKSPFL